MDGEARIPNLSLTSSMLVLHFREYASYSNDKSAPISIVVNRSLKSNEPDITDAQILRVSNKGREATWRRGGQRSAHF